MSLPSGKTIRWSAADPKVTSDQILAQISAGDTLMLAEGDYHLRPAEGDPAAKVDVRFNIVGIGRPSKTRVHGPLLSEGMPTLTFSNFTVVGSDAGAGMHLRGCQQVTINNVDFATPADAAQYALLIEDSTVSLEDCKVLATHSDPIRGAVLAAAKSVVAAKSTGLGWLRAEDDAQVNLGARCAAFRLWAQGRSQIRCKSSVRIADNSCDEFHFGSVDSSVLDLREASSRAKTFSGLVKDGATTIGKMSLPEGGVVEVTAEGNAEVSIDGAPVRLIDTGGKPLTSEEPVAAKEPLPAQPATVPDPAPPVVETRPDRTRAETVATTGSAPQAVFHGPGGGNLSTTVFPNLREGDTLVLAEGEYYLAPTQRGATAVWFNIVGVGRPGRVVLRGRIEVFGGSPVTLANLEVRGNLTRLALGDFSEPPLNLVGVSLVAE